MLFLTLTMRHRAGQSLLDLWDGVGYSWSKVTSGRGWVTDQDFYGVKGWVRVVEVTHGANGWHVHVHSLLFCDSRATLTDLGPNMFQRWRDALVRKGFDAPLARSGGLDARMVRPGDSAVMGDYFTKAQYQQKIGHEVTGGQHKSARGANRTPFQILADVVRLGESRDLALWHEWEAASSGRRQMTWSKGLRVDLCSSLDLTDQEIAEAEVGGDTLVIISAEGWRVVTRYRLGPALLTAAERDETGDSLRQVLRDHGIT